jgi:DNA helicase-2/ATP-dependent DNA helicase PcrA
VIIDALERGDIKYAGERDQRYFRTPVTRWIEEMAQWCCGVRGKEGGTFSSISDFWIGLLRNAGQRVDEENELLIRRDFFGTLTAGQVPFMQVEGWLSKIEEELSVKKVLGHNEKAPEELQAYTSMVSAFSEGGALTSYKVEDLAGCGANANRICLTTLHSSKGLQFDVVIMPGLEEGRLPSWGAKTDAAIREARRTFYVGFTRARHLVYLIYSGCYENQYGRVFKQGPSRFVVELINSLK